MNKQQGIGMPKLYINLLVKTKDGAIIHEHGEEGHSWTRNAWNAFQGTMIDAVSYGSGFGSGVLTGKGLTGVSTTNTTYTFARSSGAWSGNGFINNANTSVYGIVVGRSNSIFIVDDYALYDLISHGNGTGQLYYASQLDTPAVMSYDSNEKKYTNRLKRLFNNNSGSTITIKELGLVGNWFIGFNNTNYLMARDVLSTPVVVPNGAQLTVTYALTSYSFNECDQGIFSFPAIGTAGSGGYVLGTYASWPHPNNPYVLIISPKIGGESTNLQWRTVSTEDGLTDTYYGSIGTDYLVGLGSDSPIGVFCSSANSSLLGGYGDWYIPARLEMTDLIFPNNSTLPADQRMPTDTTRYWSSTRTSASAYYYLCSTGSAAAAATQTTAYAIRLVRRIHIADWVAA